MTGPAGHDDPDEASRGPIGQLALMLGFTIVLVGWVAGTTAAALLLPGDATDAWFDIMVVAPIYVLPLVWGLAYRRDPRLRQTMLSLDLSAITAVEGMRIAGIAMLAVWAAGRMTPLFALWAGGLDVFIGITAVPVAYLVVAVPLPPRRLLRTWHLIGLTDFLIAVPLGLLATPSALGLWHTSPDTSEMFSFPLSFIPMVGVPFMVVMHLTAILQLRNNTAPLSGPLVRSDQSKA